MTAGAIAGVLEHCVMYPFDSLKTRMQSLSPQVNYNNPLQGLTLVIRQEGIFRLFRGMGVVVAGAGPAHAMYFSIYEHLKEQLQRSSSKPSYIAAGVSGMVATLFHDGVMTPTEVVKQRLQMYKSPYKSILDCICRTYRTEGIRAFYRSYTTQLAMNIPFQIIHFMTYEKCQNLTNKDRVYNPKAHVVSGGIAGAVAAAFTTPLDVVKTLLNTQQHKVKGMVAAINIVYKVSGIWGFWKGLQPRILYQVPSTAICWLVYELFKYVLSEQKYEVKCNNKSLTPTVLLADRQISSNLRPGLFFPEVNLEPIYMLEPNKEFENSVPGHHSEYESECWSHYMPEPLRDDSVDSQCEEKIQSKDKFERTIFEKPEWSSTVISGAEIFE
ncbi:hypothetical protein RUM44_005459 [Polyplax serrata]|uniref:Mitoferrin-1 n=1 Tax=Polyplax serrata TaxID=468196 RepID=A0ABR1AW60_POLSC